MEKQVKLKTSRKTAWRNRQARVARLWANVSDSDLRAHVLDLGISPQDWDNTILPAINLLRDPA